MRQQIVRSLMAAAILLAGMTAATAQDAAQDFAQVPVQEVMLDNGLTVLTGGAPRLVHVVAAGWIAHVGLRQRDYGITGIAHLFEHMMFKGTRVIGTTDIDAELKIMAELDAVRAEMEGVQRSFARPSAAARWKARSTCRRTGPIAWRNWPTEMKALQDAQREYIVKDELIRSTPNRRLGNERGHLQRLHRLLHHRPSNKLELWFWMESNRLFEPVFREFYSERDVVREERRLRVESDPTAKFEEQFDAMFWQASPYHHPVIGWPSDVESISRARPTSSSPPTTRPTTSPRPSSAISIPPRPRRWPRGTSAAFRAARPHRPRWSPRRSNSWRSDGWPPRRTPTPRFRSAGGRELRARRPGATGRARPAS
jgi:hypothetical protein